MCGKIQGSVGLGEWLPSHLTEERGQRSRTKLPLCVLLVPVGIYTSNKDPISHGGGMLRAVCSTPLLLQPPGAPRTSALPRSAALPIHQHPPFLLCFYLHHSGEALLLGASTPGAGGGQPAEDPASHGNSERLGLDFTTRTLPFLGPLSPAHLVPSTPVPTAVL